MLHDALTHDLPKRQAVDILDSLDETLRSKLLDQALSSGIFRKPDIGPPADVTREVPRLTFKGPTPPEVTIAEASALLDTTSPSLCDDD